MALMESADNVILGVDHVLINNVQNAMIPTS